MRKWIKENKFQLIVFCIYSILAFTLIFFHENWRDEAQAWLIARDCNVLEIINLMKYEGHFLLWYLILMPFSKLGFPYITTNIISWLITCITVWLILKKAPFKFYKKVLFIFTFPLLYLLPVISRCYCLIPLVIVIMCIFYNTRKEKPFRYLMSVILLANTHIIMMAMVGLVLLDFFLEIIKEWKKDDKNVRNKKIISFVISIILLFLAIFPLFGCLTTNSTVGKEGGFLLKLIQTFFYKPIALINGMFVGLAQFEIIISMIIICIIILLFFEIKKNKLDLLKIFICVIYQCLIYSFIFGESLQKTSIVIFIILYFKWINVYKEDIKTRKIEEKIVNSCYLILLILNIISGIIYINYEISCNFSNANEVKDFIDINIENDSAILTGSKTEYVSSIIPYLSKNINFYHIQPKRNFTYAIWDDYNIMYLEKDNIYELTNCFSNEQKLYYIYCFKNSTDELTDNEIKERELISQCVVKGVFKEIYTTKNASLVSENYILYEVKLDNISEL